MNKTAIKNYATWARTELIKKIAQKAYQFEVTETSLPEYNTDSVHGNLLSNEQKQQLNELIIQVKKHGYMHVIEEVAYTWFNRFIALRYMEVNNYLPQRVRVFTNESNELQPEILTDAMHIELDGLDKQKVFKLLEDNNKDELYKYLLLTLCNDMNRYLPEMFSSISDYKTLLLPDNLLEHEGVLFRLVNDMDEDTWSDQVQIIGWLYQYYNSELKDTVMKKKNYTKDDIPAATQLFTPDWIVRYMTENSLGRLWIDGHPNFDHSNWKYYLEEAKQNQDVLEQLNKIKEEHSKLKPEEIRVIDPCMGSGHILVYAFDVLMDIYRDAGWSDRDASKSILENNLYGLEIDERAYHLAYFAIMMKARFYNRRILSCNTEVNLVEIRESNYDVDDDVIEHLGECKNLGYYLLNTFKEAKEFGSILNLDCSIEQLNELVNNLDEVNKISNYGSLIDQADLIKLIDIFNPLLKQAKLLVQKYDVVITNPPYMAPSPKQKPFVQKHYPNSKTDLFAVFIDRNINFSKNKGYISMITQPSLTSLVSFEKLRKYLFSKKLFLSVLHMGRGIFGIDFGSLAFCICNDKIDAYIGKYFKLYNRTFQYITSDSIKELFLNARRDNNVRFDFSTYDTALEINKTNLNTGDKICYDACQNYFLDVPGIPFAYSMTRQMVDSYKNGILKNVFTTREGMATAGNDIFLRLWYEVSFLDINFKCMPYIYNTNTKWVPYNKGGDFRKWYGNNYYIVYWLEDGLAIKNNKDMKTGRVRSHNYNGEYAFRKGLTWSSISAGNISVRWCGEGFLFDSKGAKGFAANDNILYGILAFLNSSVTMEYLKVLAPTMDYKVGDISMLPFSNHLSQKSFLTNVKQCINYSKKDWDSFETSWDFKVHPLVKNHASTIGEAYNLWSKECEDRFNTLKSNEKELNRIFIEIYGLQGELDPYVEDKDVTVRKADLARDIKSFISYAVGCMFGRYSLDVEGLAYAGGEWDNNKYSTFIPDNDDIIPICDEDYFEDDILTMFIEFVKVVYDSDTLEENLQLIANALGGKGTPREVLRNYFLNDFFKDHCNTYQVTGSGKRPIYWLFDSGKKNGFKALVYIHRYTPDLIARMRTGYIHPQQARYRTQIEMLQGQIHDASNSSEKVKLSKQFKKINEQLLELNKYEEVIHHWADKMEPMDLDDGVKVNYAKFQELLAKIK